MILLTIDEIIRLQELLIDRTGGSYGIRDHGLIESAIYNINSTYENFEAYPTIEEKASRLAYSLIKNHAFIDGNKRIGILAMLLTLELNEIKIYYSQDELVKLGLSIADGTIEFSNIYKWVKQHKKIPR